MRTLSLGWLTLPNANNKELVLAAASAGFNAVGLRTARPASLGYATKTQQGLDENEVLQLRTLLADTGIKVLHGGGFWLDSQIHISDYERTMAYGSELGSSMMIAIATPEMVRTEIMDKVAKLGELAKKYQMRVAIEFATYTGIKTIEQADQIATASGSNVGILVDALHLYRSGGVVQSIASVSKDRLFLAQLCDGSLRSPVAEKLPFEARHERGDPGEGELPLVEFIKALPPDVPLEVEVPKFSLNHLTNKDRAHICIELTNKVIKDALSF